MTAKDKNIWEIYTRNVKPARAKKPLTLKKEGKKQKAKIRDEILPEYKMPIPISTPPLTLPVSALERKREKNLRQGKIEIEAKIDLHGMTQAEAYDALTRFMARQIKTAHRHLLIITGKGRAGEGILRRNLKDWLSQLPEAKAILALRPAAPQHGGDGAFYVVLRKTKS